MDVAPIELRGIAILLDKSAKKWGELDRKTGFAGFNGYADKKGKMGFMAAIWIE